MEKTLIYIFVSIIFSMFLFSACSNENAELEKGVIEEFTEKSGKGAAENIKSPLEKSVFYRKRVLKM